MLSTDIFDVRFKGIDATLRSPVNENFILNVSLSYTHFNDLTLDTVIGLSDSQVDILEDDLEGEFELRIGVDQKLGDNLCFHMVPQWLIFSTFRLLISV